MVDFVRLADTAARLIEENGRTVSIVKHGSTPGDAGKPWRGVSAPVEATVEGKAAFVPRTLLATTYGEQVDGVLAEGEYALFAADNDEGYNLETFNVIVDGDRDWKIMRVELIAPADTRILYMIEVKR